MTCTALRILLLAVALVLLPFIRAAASEDKITIILNNKIAEDKNAEDFPLFYRYKKKYLLDKDKRPTLNYITVPIRTIKFTILEKMESL